MKTKLASVDINIKKHDIVRFHRSAKPSRNRDGILVAQTIIKFARWGKRSLAHFVNKRAREEKKGFRIHNDLTQRRYQLLNRARDVISTRFPTENPNDRPSVIAFANVNSNLIIRSGREKYQFNTESELDNILNEISG